jgi:hypothetical protein
MHFELPSEHVLDCHQILPNCSVSGWRRMVFAHAMTFKKGSRGTQNSLWHSHRWWDIDLLVWLRNQATVLSGEQPYHLHTYTMQDNIPSNVCTLWHTVHMLDDVLIVRTCTVWIKLKMQVKVAQMWTACSYFYLTFMGFMCYEFLPPN